MLYQLIQIPKSSNNIVEVEADSVLDLIAKVKVEGLVDLSFEWVIYENGKSKGFIEHTKYSCLYSDNPEKHTTKRLRDMSKSKYFDTPQEAIADRKRFQPQANKKLDEVEADFKALCDRHKATISYVMDGDTHGIYEDYMYAAIEVEGYQFSRKLSD